MLSELSDSKQIIIDVNNDRYPDVIFHQRENELFQFFYKGKKKKAIRKYVSKKEYFTEFYEINDKTWNLIKSETIQLENNELLKKTVTTYFPTKKQKIFFVPTFQYDRLGMPEFNPLLTLNQLMEIPDVVWDHPESQENWYLLKDHFDNNRCEFNGILMERFMQFPVRQFMEQSFKTINFSNYIDDDNTCGAVCNPNEGWRDCQNGDGFVCPGSQKDVINRSLHEKISCLFNVNPGLAGQMLGLLLANNLKEGTSNCFGSNENNCFHHKIRCEQFKYNNGVTRYSLKGRTQLPCDGDKWPSIQIQPISCKFSEEEFGNTIFHELFHSLGYSHGESPEYAYACTLACGNFASHQRRMKFSDSVMVNSWSAARRYCSGNLENEETDLFKIFRFLDKPNHFYNHISYNLNPEFFQKTTEILIKEKDQFSNLAFGVEKAVNENFKTHARTELYAQILLFSDIENLTIKAGENFSQEKKLKMLLEDFKIYPKYEGLFNKIREKVSEGNYDQIVEFLHARSMNLTQNKNTEKGVKRIVQKQLELYCRKIFKTEEIRGGINLNTVNTCMQFLR